MMKTRNRDVEERLRRKIYCAQLYYQKLPNLSHPLNQSEIAEMLGISPSQVSYLIKEAYQEGLLEVIIHAPRSCVLEGELVHTYRRYGLQQARVVMLGSSEFEPAIIDSIGDCAAAYVEEVLEPGMKVGISGGRTVRNMVERIRLGRLRGLEIYPVESRGTLEVSANTIAANLAAKCEESKVHGLPIPTLMAGTVQEARQVLDYLFSIPSIAKVRDGFGKLDATITGVAPLMDPGSSRKSAEYFEVELEFIERISEEAVGCIIWDFFDKNGEVVESDLHERVVAIRLQQLREIALSPHKRAIAIAGGKHKVEAIRAAMFGGFMDTLITDTETAEKLVESG